MVPESMAEAIMALYVETRTRIKTVVEVSTDWSGWAPRIYIIVIHCGNGCGNKKG